MTETDIENQAENPGKPAAKKPLDPVSVELVKARKAAGLTQQELHLKTGVSRDSIKGYESGRSLPGSRELRLLCEALGVSANRALWGREDFQEAPGPVKGRLMGKSAGQLADAMKLMSLLAMLSQEEVDALFTLIEPIVIGRHGRKELEKAFVIFDVLQEHLGVDMEKAIEAGMSGALTDEGMAAINAKAEAAARRRGPRK